MAARAKKAAPTATAPLPGIDLDGARAPARGAKPRGRGKPAGRAAVVAHASWRRRLMSFAARWVGVAVEAGALVSFALAVIVVAFSRFVDYFVGSSLVRGLLPFVGLVLGLGLATALFLGIWFRFRREAMRIGRAGRYLAPALAVVGAASTHYFWWTGPARDDVRQLQTIVGGPAEAEKAAIAHQVFASYRRADLDELRVILERGVVYESTILEAADALSMDAEILMGIAATESSFYPRASRDGGQGLFQITRPPTEAVATAKRLLGVEALDPVNQRHNAYLGAATYRLYHAQMRGDLFLGLLAYNIGPHNGGLRAIMNQYGARDFMTVQPYLKSLPRDYPIRVLTAALAQRIWKREGELPRYEEGGNAARIQNIGVPGLDRGAGLSLLADVVPD